MSGASIHFSSPIHPLRLRFIIPPTINLDVPLTDRIDFKVLRTHRALSQTCRSLRNFTLPLVWARVEVKTVKQLVELHELLQAFPNLAPLIRSFRFLWNMGGDCSDFRLMALREEEGTTLDLAFRDRLQMWDNLMKQRGDEAIVDFACCCVELDNLCCDPPGAELDCDDWDALEEQVPVLYDWQDSEGGVGPDGDGEDELIKNPHQLTQCIIEIVNMLPSLATFGWETPVMPMPREVFDSLLQLGTPLSDLRLVFSSYRGNFTDCEYMSCWDTLCTEVLTRRLS